MNWLNYVQRLIALVSNDPKLLALFQDLIAWVLDKLHRTPVTETPPTPEAMVEAFKAHKGIAP